MIELIERNTVRSLAFRGAKEDSTLEVMEAVLAWIREHPDVSIVSITVDLLAASAGEEQEEIVVFYE